jgi:3-phenylpropionate/cinnamic acid dioxygenase small subunit
MPDNCRTIENLIYSYAQRIDNGDLSGLAELFRHGRIQAAPGFVFEGTDQIRQMYEGATRLHSDGTPRTKHVTTNVAVEIDEDAGVGAARSYYTVFQQTDELPLQPIICGHYHDTFHRRDGEWWFDTREIFVDLIGDLSHHLLFELQ